MRGTLNPGSLLAMVFLALLSSSLRALSVEPAADAAAMAYLAAATLSLGPRLTASPLKHAAAKRGPQL
jgi:hypothetical protein